MVKRTIAQQNPGTGLVNPNALIIFDQDNETFEAKFSEVQSGSEVVPISRESDLPPLINGFRTLEINKSYNWHEASVHVDPILIPAGWVGAIRKTFLSKNSIAYGGGGSMFSTLNLDGAILSIADSGTEPGVKSTVTTTAPKSINCIVS